MALLVVVLIALATYHQTSAGPWIIGLVLFWLLITFVLSVVVTPSYERGYYQPHVTFVSSFLSLFITIFIVEFVGVLLLYVILGAKPAEIQEQLDMLSVPLGWFSPQFVITPHRSLLDACGIMLGNSFLLGIPFFACVKLVQVALRRNRVVQIGIDRPSDQTDD